MIIKPKYYGPAIPSTYAVTMTAAASGSNGITVADDNDIDFGTGDFFLHWEGSLPDWTPSTFELIRKTPSSADSGYALYIDSSPAGRLLLSLVNGGVAELQINSTVATGVADGGIAKITVAVVRETASVAGSATFYLNGAILGAAVAITAGAPYSISNALSMYVSGSATRRTASNTISCIVGNFAPTAAEVLDLCTNGIPESWKWGSQAARTATWTNESFTTFSSSGANITQAASSGAATAIARGVAGERLSAGFKYRISFTISGTISTALTFRAASTASTLAGTISLNEAIAGAGDYVFEVTPLALSYIGFRAGAAAGNYDFATSGFTVTQIGATMALLPNSIPTSGATAWDDSSGNTGGGTLPAAGATKVTIRR